jgi:penicillin-binding protein-related factor A (putative recombinase)
MRRRLVSREGFCFVFVYRMGEDRAYLIVSEEDLVMVEKLKTQGKG